MDKDLKKLIYLRLEYSQKIWVLILSCLLVMGYFAYSLILYSGESNVFYMMFNTMVKLVELTCLCVVVYNVLFSRVRIIVYLILQIVLFFILIIFCFIIFNNEDRYRLVAEESFEMQYLMLIFIVSIVFVILIYLFMQILKFIVKDKKIEKVILSYRIPIPLLEIALATICFLQFEVLSWMFVSNSFDIPFRDNIFLFLFFGAAGINGYLIYRSLYFLCNRVDGVNIDIKTINISAEESLENLYLMRQPFMPYLNYRIVQFDFSMPGNLTVKNVYLHNAEKLINDTSANKSNNKVYACLPIKKRKTSVFVQFVLELSQGEQIFQVKMKVKLDVSMNEDCLVIHKYSIYELQRMWGKCNSSVEEKTTVEEKTSDKYKTKTLTCSWNKHKYLNKAYLYNLYYNDELELESFYQILNKSNASKRKMIVHDGAFGIGKSTLDVFGVSNAGYQPVVISPWEEHYDKDILFLIFKKLRKMRRNTVVFPIQYENVVLFGVVSYALFCAILPILRNIIQHFDIDSWAEIKEFTNITVLEFLPFAIEKIATGVILQKHLWMLVALILSLLISAYLLPSIIIYLRNFTKTYQDFYVKYITKILSKTKTFMIIEDVDRLDKEVIKDLFRTISKLNNETEGVNRLIGMLSYSKCNMLKIFDDNKDSINNLENKVVYQQVLQGYDLEKSQKKYMKEIVYVVYFLYLEEKNLNQWKYIENKIDTLTIEIDFRSLRDNLEKWFNELSKSEGSLGINDIINKLSTLVVAE